MDESTPELRPLVGAVRTPDEHADLLAYHISRLRKQRAQVVRATGPVDEARADLKIERDLLAKQFDEAQGDLGRDYTRKYLEGLIEDGDVRVPVAVAFEKRRARDKAVLNQPVFGLQPDLFPGEETPTAARDEMAWEAEGYRRGLCGDLDELQAGDPPAFHQAIMRGFEKGQAATAERVARAMEAKAKAGQPDPEQAPVELNEAEPGTHEAKAAERKSIAKAKESLGVSAPANKVPA